MRMNSKLAWRLSSATSRTERREMFGMVAEEGKAELDRVKKEGKDWRERKDG